MEQHDVIPESKPAHGAVTFLTPVEVFVQVAAGRWRVDAWLPEQAQGPLSKHRLVGRFTGNSVRRLGVQISGSGVLLAEDSATGEMVVRTTKRRETLRFEVAAATTVVLRFTTRAVVLPVNFSYCITGEDAARHKLLPRLSSAAEAAEAEAEAEAGGTQTEANASGSSLTSSLASTIASTSASEGGPVKYSIDWIEARFASLAIEDKLRIAQVVRAAHARGWQELSGACAAGYDNGPAVAEMARDSAYKTRAWDKGVIRPFLLLVSMHPGRRVGWAIALDINLPRHSEYGDAHWEALEMLTHSRLGILARAQRTYREKLNPLSRKLDWYQLLHRVLTSINTTKAPGPRSAFQKEGMEPAVKQQLHDTKVDKGTSKELSQLESLADAPRELENAFAEAFMRAGADHFFPGGKFDMYSSGEKEVGDDRDREGDGDDDGDGDIDDDGDGDIGDIGEAGQGGGQLGETMSLSREDFREAALDMVESTPELAEMAARMRKHGFRNEAQIAFFVLNSWRREAQFVNFAGSESGPAAAAGPGSGASGPEGGITLNKQWGSQGELFSEEYKATVALKCKQEKRALGQKVMVGASLPVALAAMSITPAPLVVLMLTRVALKARYPALPSSLAGIVSGLVLQRSWLAVADISIEQFYPAAARATQAEKDTAAAPAPAPAPARLA